MCGIIGILGKEPVAPGIVDALRRLEYRGYDSAGVATLENGTLTRRRAVGKLRNLDGVLQLSPLQGRIGIGHTRWATHGKPTEANAHPHATADVAVVHNGIIENFRELRAELAADGANFESQTDTELVAHLVTREMRRGAGPADAVEKTLKRLEGAFALAFLFDGEEDLLIGARRGSPLAIGYGDGEMFLGSDAMALAPFTNRIAYLDEGDWVVMDRAGADVRDETGKRVKRKVQTSLASAAIVEKGNYRHFMAKEIHEQPEVLSHTLARYLDMGSGTVRLPDDLPFDFATVSRVTFAACGTGYLAALAARYWFETYAKLPTDIDVASEFRYREAPLDPNGIAIVVSQSGETADTLAALRYCKSLGVKVAGVVNVATSTIAREADIALPMMAGPEIGVASTKAFTCSMAVLACLAIGAGRARGVLTAEQERELVAALTTIPRLVGEAIALEPKMEPIAKMLTKASDVLYIGRGPSYALALEGALKLKELSYIHAEGYGAGELKHGPSALIDETMPVIVVAPHDKVFEKTVSNMQEVAARGGRIILLTDPTGAAHAGETEATLVMPAAHPIVAPFVQAIPVQLIAYHTAVMMGTDVDQPRNLAKSVTVE